VARSLISLAAWCAVAPPLLGALASGVSARQAPPDSVRITVSGTVYDRGSGAPIPGAAIHLAGTGLRATSGIEGRYVLAGVPRGSYQLEVDAPGYRSLRGAIRMLRTGEMNLPLEPALGTAPGGRTSRIIGHVLSMEANAPVEGAEITLPGGGVGQVTDREGRFELRGLSPGLHSFSVRYLGRAPLHAEVEVPPEGTLEVEVRLAVEPVEMAPMTVTATPRDSYLEAMGYYRRRDEGRSGTQITRETLLEKAPRSLSEVLVSVPGLRVLPGSLGDFQVRMRRAISLSAGGGEGCAPALFVDDVRSDIGWLQDLDPGRVEAMEIYAGANAPLRYNDPCGVILVWTRRGERRQGRGGAPLRGVGHDARPG
jgi:hypothetical protein